MIEQLYIRKGNLPENKRILIIGEEAELGSRDSAYLSKGTLKGKTFQVDPYTGAKDLDYIHACPNILLNSTTYSNDHAVHRFVKEHCKDLVKWDGESSQGLTNSREAFLILPVHSINRTIKKLRKRIQAVVRPETFLQRLQGWKYKLFISASERKKFRKRRKFSSLTLIFWILLIGAIFVYVKYPNIRDQTNSIVLTFLKSLSERIFQR